jgi:hypothetical protein
VLTEAPSLACQRTERMRYQPLHCSFFSTHCDAYNSRVESMVRPLCINQQRVW